MRSHGHMLVASPRSPNKLSSLSRLAYLCQCPTGFYGTRCELRNYCTPNPCANNGLCTQTTTGYICACTFPFTGTNCQQSTSPRRSPGERETERKIFPLPCFSVISTTARTTPIATRAPCGGNCACVISPCPVAVITNPCVPNPWLVPVECVTHASILFARLVKIWEDVPFRTLGRSATVQTCTTATTAKHVGQANLLFIRAR